MSAVGLPSSWIGCCCCVLWMGSAAQANFLVDLPMTVVTQTRRFLNLNGLFGSSTYAPTPYDRVAGHPVFQVTTAWGSAYMNMEKINDLEDDSGGNDNVINPLKRTKKNQALSNEQNEYRTVALYFMDPDDAMGVHGELKQMEQMTKSDIRITATSLARALRQSANLGNGIVTGLPIDPLTGKVNPEEGGCLRHKIMPPKRQLYYAARCVGRERVGLFGDTPQEDAALSIMGNSALESVSLARRREIRDRKVTTRNPLSTIEAQNMHMEGYVGIPVFYCPQMRKKQPKLKQWISGVGQENPLFFDYEDLVAAWGKLKRRNPNLKLPDTPPTVEVFNLWDVLTSMDKESWLKKKQPKDWMKPIQKRFGSNEPPGLESLTFIPSSRCIDYKEAISRSGNGKARLRPMR